MTNAAAVLLNMTPPANARTQDAPAAQKTGKKATNSTVSKENINTCEQTTERSGTFEDALKKRLKKTATTDNTAVIEPENADIPQPVALELTAVLSTRHEAPILPKTAADQASKELNKQTQKPIFRTENVVSAAPQAAKTAPSPVPDTAAKTDSKPVAQRPEQSSALQTKSPEENEAKPPKNAIINTEKPSDPLTGQEKLTPGKGVDLPKNSHAFSQDAHPRKTIELTPAAFQDILKNTPFTAKNSTAAPQTPTEKDPVSSLKKSAVEGVKADSSDKSTPEQTTADPKLTQFFDSKEKTPSVYNVAPNAALDSTDVATHPTAATTPIQVDSAKGVTDVSAARPIDQIVQTLQLRTFGADSQVRMMLAPEELGAIRITFRQINNEVVGLLEVQKTETRKEIAQSISQLTAAMETAGIQIRRIEVVPWTSNPQTPRGEQFTQDFDAASHQEMYRSGGESKTQNQSNNRLANDSASPPTRSFPLENNDFDSAERGLNFFI
jgi:hypothetical protein